MIGLAPMPLGFAHDTTALVYQRACQYWLGHLLVRLIIITTGRVCVCYRLTDALLLWAAPHFGLRPAVYRGGGEAGGGKHAPPRLAALFCPSP